MPFNFNSIKPGAFLAGLFFSSLAFAKTSETLEKIDSNLFNEQFEFLLVLVILALLPLIAVMCTSFTKIVVVLSIARQAIGTAQTPPNIVIMTIALMLTAFSMYPVAKQIQNDVDFATLPAKKTAAFKEISAGAVPIIKEYLSKHAEVEDKKLFLDLLKGDAHEQDLIILAPAFLISELSRAFQIGFLIFLPFLVIDMVVANILMALGMQMLSPTTISLPFKILLFVLVDGWRLLAQGLLGVG